MDEDELSGCRGKVTFASRNAADRVQRRRAGKWDREYQHGEPYKCRYCHGWHIGHRQDERQKKQMRRFMARFEKRAP